MEDVTSEDSGIWLTEHCQLFTGHYSQPVINEKQISSD